ncbi:MAG: hypothetical protein ACNS60_16075 [Candidatus Cyclobacteriaceae bacterium M2_1C_046]
MAKLKNIIKQLSENDYNNIYNLLIESSAEKSAYLLRAMREKQVSDKKIMEELDVNTNAYYTLRSRLNQKIEEYLLQQMESPRTDILRKVANINEILFTKKRAIAVATLKKLEKELLDYDLSNELTVIYKSLKKININSPDYFNYKQLYNRHVAYTLATDKAEDLLAEYFKKYSSYFLSGDSTEKLELSLLLREMRNVSALYESHRLFVFQSCMEIFHRLFVEPEESLDEDLEPIEDILDKVENTFNTYSMDSIYYHLNLLFEFLKFEYYNHYKLYRKAEKYFEELNDAVGNLLNNYATYTFPSRFLISKLERHLRSNTEDELYQENIALFEDYEIDQNALGEIVVYHCYRGLTAFYVGEYNESARWFNNLLNEPGLKKNPLVQLEIKVLLALQYALKQDLDLFTQLINSIQRQIRIIGKENCEHLVSLIKLLRVQTSSIKKGKPENPDYVVDKIKQVNKPYFTPTRLLKLDEKFFTALERI